MVHYVRVPRRYLPRLHRRTRLTARLAGSV